MTELAAYHSLNVKWGPHMVFIKNSKLKNAIETLIDKNKKKCGSSIEALEDLHEVYKFTYNNCSVSERLCKV